MRLRQQLLMISSLVLTLAATTAVSLSALDASEQRNAELISSLNTTDSDESTTEADASGTGAVASPNEKPGLWVTGDSVILGIRSQLEEYEPIDLINARVGRQISELIEVIEVDAKSVPNAITVLNLGNNGPISEAQVRKLFSLLAEQPHVIAVNAAVPRGWRDSNNEILQLVIKDFPNATLIDWNRISNNHPEYFAPDGVHLVPTGANVYVASILEVLEQIGYRD